MNRPASLLHIVGGLMGVILVAALALGYAAPPASAAPTRSAHLRAAGLGANQAAATPRPPKSPADPAACTAGQAGEDVFTGLASPPDPHQWLTAGNWSEGRIPGATDFACIPATYGTYVQYDGNDSIPGYEIAGVNDEGTQGLNVVNNTLPIVGTSQPSAINDLTMAGITDSGLSVATGSSLYLTGTASIDSSSSLMSGPGTIDVLKGADVSFPQDVGFNAGLQFNNFGTLTGLNGQLCDSSPGPVVVTNEAKGKMVLNSGGALSDTSGGNCTSGSDSGVVINDPKASITATVDSFDISAQFDNQGTVADEDNPLTGSNGLVISDGNVGDDSDAGTYSTKSTKKDLGEIDFAYPRNETGAKLTGSGTFGFNANGIDLDDPTLATVVQAGGTNGGMVITKGLTFVGSELGDVTQSDTGPPTTTEIRSGATLTFGDAGGGGANFTGGHLLVIDGGGKAVDEGTGICLDGGSTITNSGIWTFASGGGSVSNCASGSSSMINEGSGSVVASDPAQNSAIDVPFTNDGSVTVSAEGLTVTGPATDTGSWTVAHGTTLYFAGVGTSTVTGSFTASGTVQADCYATLGLSGQHLTNLVLGGYTSGDYSLAGALTFTGFPACNNLPTINIPSGPVSLAGNYVPTPGQEQPVLQVTVSGPSSFGQLQVAGSASLSGDQLLVDTAAGFTPTLGQSFQILSAATTTGNFSLEGDNCAGTGVAYQSVPDSNGVSLNVVADASCP